MERGLQNPHFVFQGVVPYETSKEICYFCCGKVDAKFGKQFGANVSANNGAQMFANNVERSGMRFCAKTYANSFHENSSFLNCAYGGT